MEGTEAEDDAANPDYDEDESGEVEIDTPVFILSLCIYVENIEIKS